MGVGMEGSVVGLKEGKGRIMVDCGIVVVARVDEEFGVE